MGFILPTHPLFQGIHLSEVHSSKPKMNIPSDHHSLYFNHDTIYLGYGHLDYGINWVRTYLGVTYGLPMLKVT
jgi:hypothetical protein